MLLAMAFAASSDSIDDYDDLILLDDEEETVLIVRQRAPLPLYPSSRTIRAAEFQGRFADLPSVLETVSGVDIRSMGGRGQYAESAIRGAAAQGIRVYLDGVLLNSAAAGAVDLSKVPLSRIQEIRVTKNAAGLRRMGTGMGGVIELFTGAADERIIGASIEAGSFGYAGAGALVKSGGHQFNLDALTADNNYPFIHDNGTTIPTIRDPDPTWDDTLMRKRNNYYRSVDAGYGYTVHINDNHRISQQAGASAFEQGLFVYHYKRDQSGSTGGLALTYSAEYAGSLTERFTVGGAVSGAWRHGRISDPDGRFSLGGAGKELASAGRTADVLVDARYSLTDNFYLAGLAGMRAERHVQRNLALTERPEMARYEYRAGAEAGLEAGAVASALRVVCKYDVDTSTAGLGYWSSDGRRYTLRYPLAEAVVNVNLSPLRLRFSAAASKRTPTFFERFGWGSAFLSNPELREETRLEADAGATLDMGQYAASASVFAGSVGNKIKSIPRGGGFVKVMNFADTRFYGAEIDLSARLPHRLTIELNGAYLKSVISDAADPAWINRIEPFVPALSGYVKTEFETGRFNVGHGIKFEGECYLGIDNRATRPHQTELSAWVSLKAAEFLTMRYRVDNYLNSASFDFLDNPKPRRTHVVSAALTF
jgi:iron complex outermembrane receptor protein